MIKRIIHQANIILISYYKNKTDKYKIKQTTIVKIYFFSISIYKLDL